MGLRLLTLLTACFSATEVSSPRSRLSVEPQLPLMALSHLQTQCPGFPGKMVKTAPSGKQGEASDVITRKPFPSPTECKHCVFSLLAVGQSQAPQWAQVGGGGGWKPTPPSLPPPPLQGAWSPENKCEDKSFEDGPLHHQTCLDWQNRSYEIIMMMMMIMTQFEKAKKESSRRQAKTRAWEKDKYISKTC